jgi:outer membrane protein insertion porin family
MKHFTFLFCMVASVAFSADVTEVKVKALDGFGGDSGSVASRCQTKVGAAYDPVTLTRDVNSLKDSGEFEEISANAQRTDSGVEVVFYVKRKMRFHAPVAVKGNDFFSESRISKEAELKDGSLYGESDLAAAAAKVRLAYQKKYYTDAKVTPMTEVIGGNDIKVTFMIVEGVRQKIDEYVFDGCKSIDEDELHAAIDDFPWWNPVGWFADSPVTFDQQAQCCDKIASVYRDHGFLDVKVAEPERVPSESAGKVNVVFKIDEGVRYKVGTTAIKGLTRYPEIAVREKSQLPAAGSIAGEKELNAAARRIAVTVGSGDSGLADTRVEVKRIPSAADPSVIDLVFQVTEGVPVVINEVNIRGNDYTKDKVIRREIALGPGDRMLEDRAERSQKRLENLDYFSRVRYYLEPTDKGLDANGAEYRNLVYEVDEKNTGSFMVGVGASSVDSVYISAEVNQNNFDLFAPGKLFRGGGQKGRAYVAWGPRYQSAEIGVVEPYLFDRHLELSVDAYRRMRWYDQYDIIRSGAQASLSYPVKFWPTWNPFGRLGVGLSGEMIEFDDVEHGEYEFNKKPVSYQEEKQKYDEAFEPVLHLFWAKDSRDSFRMPTKGHRTRLFVDLAPGGDNEYWRLGFNHRSYFTVWKRYNHVLMTGLRAETIDGFSDDVPIYNRMFLGGPKSIRGIEYRHVSPMAKKKGSNEYDPWGGQTLFCANFEYTIPIVKMFRVALFSDLGSVGVDEFDLDFDDTFAWTVGIGFRLDLPMFPIRLDFGTPIVEPDEADKEVFSFTVGYDF